MELLPAQGLLRVFVSLLLLPWCGGTKGLHGSQARQNHLQDTANGGLCSDGVASLGYYNGSLSVTESGSDCLNWAEFPDYIQQYPDKGLGDHNYCRTPDGGTRPWCFYRHYSGAVGWALCDCSQGAVRLTGGHSHLSGRVELYYNGIWGTICDEEWTDWDASVICRQLGLSEIGMAVKNISSSSQLALTHLHTVTCRGDENMLLQCSYSKAVTRGCNHGNAAAVTCTPPEGLEAPLRLVGGKELFEGRVEVFHDGRWGTVCDDRWDDSDAEVVCRQLGLSGKPKAWVWAHYGQGSGPILLDEVECLGRELSLDQCRKSNWGDHNCDHIEDAGVSCDPFTDGTVRLTGGSSPSEGRVEVYYSGDWGTVCDDGWTELSAQVVCRQLGFSGSASVASDGEFDAGEGFILLDEVACSGLEDSLLDCPHSSWGQHDCSHAEDVGVRCSNDSNDITDVPSGPAVRLVNGESTKEGRVELFLNGEWGSVCDDGWTDRDAAVVCRQLGYRGGWPWQASLRLKGFYRETRLLCGATLISSCWVLTAAHCFKRFGRDARRYALRVGDYHTGVEDEFERELPVEKIVVPRKYHSSSNDRDIALVRLRGKEEQCLAFNRHVLPICLPERGQKFSSRQACFISGWGDTGKTYSRTLLQGAVPLLPKESCETRYGGKFTKRMLCSGNLSEDKRVDSCQGDSGGPLMCQRSSGHWVILGITSWGYGCGQKDFPGVYTKVSKFIPWIKKVTKQP
ncbi:neurotrypsin-like isoform X2 [Rhinatrema bivittatum]|uniref:neurotrypsin-like isoform X2 n=1 Tax=Rhinatrema bivittatum TaxID=194408 RepID=UPI00112D0F3D|nr:neurotrypsin-like isoform X2 [Rhinatrema bivittatum]